VKVISENMGKTLSTSKAKYSTVFDGNAKRARLVIPRKFIAKAEQAPETKEAQEEEQEVNAGTGHTMMAGMALSLGLVSGGLWWSRRTTGALRKGHIALLAGFGVLAVSALTASVLWADLAAPPFKDKGKGFLGGGPGPNVPGPGPGFPQPGGGFAGQGKVDIDVEITEKGEMIYLVLPTTGNMGGLTGPGIGPNPGFGPGNNPNPGFGPGPGFNPGDPLLPKDGGQPKKDGGLPKKGAEED